MKAQYVHLGGLPCSPLLVVTEVTALPPAIRHHPSQERTPDPSPAVSTELNQKWAITRRRLAITRRLKRVVLKWRSLSFTGSLLYGLCVRHLHIHTCTRAHIARTGKGRVIGGGVAHIVRALEGAVPRAAGVLKRRGLWQMNHLLENICSVASSIAARGGMLACINFAVLLAGAGFVHAVRAFTNENSALRKHRAMY